MSKILLRIREVTAVSWPDSVLFLAALENDFHPGGLPILDLFPRTYLHGSC